MLGLEEKSSNPGLFKTRALFIRLDKIGDLVCTLPADELALDLEVLWIVAKGLGFVADHAVPKRNYIELDKKVPLKKSIQKLTEIIREFKPDVAVSFQAPWWVSYTLWKEGIPLRVGSRSQWHCLFLNASLRQQRSLALQHEAEYNGDLVRHALKKSAKKKTAKLTNTSNFDAVATPDTTLGAPRGAQMPVPILRMDLTPQEELMCQNHPELQTVNNEYCVLHAGMAGSALNWPVKNWIDFANKILNETKLTLVITGTTMDDPWVRPILKALENHSQSLRILNLQNKLGQIELLYVLKKAKLVLAPSTGVLHLAASLGTRTIGLYSPIKVQNLKRWGARGAQVELFEPNHIQCPAGKSCLNDKCKYYLCMNKITVTDIFQKIV